MSTVPVAILDANVLYSAPLRHLLIWLAVVEAFDARWTDGIQDEWTRSLLRDQPHLDRNSIETTRALMEESVEDAVVTGYEHRIAGLTLPDPNDRHVLAAAIHCGATIIVTKNLKDFPAEALAPLGIVALHPDAFMRYLIESNTDAVIEGVRSHRRDLVRPPRSPTEYLKALADQGLAETAKALEAHAQEI